MLMLALRPGVAAQEPAPIDLGAGADRFEMNNRPCWRAG